MATLVTLHMKGGALDSIETDYDDLVTIVRDDDDFTVDVWHGSKLIAEAE